MSKRTATKPAAKGRSQKRSYAIGKPCTEEDPEAALLPIPDEFLREEISFWSWGNSPEGELWFEMSDTLEVLLKMWASMLGNVNSSGPMPVGLILTNPFDVLISSIRIFRNKQSRSF
jgi:hypothetical protein